MDIETKIKLLELVEIVLLIFLLPLSLKVVDFMRLPNSSEMLMKSVMFTMIMVMIGCVVI